MGTAQNKKVYARYGAGENIFGVSFANLKILTKKIKKDHALAVRLWESGNVNSMTQPKRSGKWMSITATPPAKPRMPPLI